MVNVVSYLVECEKHCRVQQLLLAAASIACSKCNCAVYVLAVHKSLYICLNNNRHDIFHVESYCNACP